jgi:hypothetical protein
MAVPSAGLEATPLWRLTAPVIRKKEMADGYAIESANISASG